MKSAMNGTGALANAVEVTHSPFTSSSHWTTSGWCPPRLMADRALSEMLATCGGLENCKRISSAIVVDIRCCALCPLPFTGMPYVISSCDSSSVHSTSLLAPLSHHWLSTMPWIAGTVPVLMLAWPAQVTLL